MWRGDGVALTRDHENGMAQQSLTRFECADSPFGLMPYGIAKANLRIRPSGLLRHPDTKSAFALHEITQTLRTYLDRPCCRSSTTLKPKALSLISLSASLSLNRTREGNEQPTFRIFSCSAKALFVSDDATRPEGLLRRDGMGRVEDSRPIGVELKQIAVRRLVASAVFVVARQRIASASLPLCGKLAEIGEEMISWTFVWRASAPTTIIFPFNLTPSVIAEGVFLFTQKEKT